MATAQLYQQSEVVRKEMPSWMSKPWNVAMDLLKKGEVTQVGERDFRAPSTVSNGGRVGTYNPQGGDMGRGTGPSGVVQIYTYFPLRLNYEIDHLSIKATQTKSTAIRNPFKDMLKNAIPEFMIYRDKFAHCDGTAVLATATATATASGKTTYTCDTNQGVMLLRRGQFVTVYNNALTSVLSSSTLSIEQWDPQARTVRLSGTVAGAGADDKITFEGVSGSSPAGINGFKYFNNSATSGTTGGINRANENEIIANSVNVNGTIANEHGMALYHRILRRRGMVADNMVGLCPLAQEAAIMMNVMSIQRIDLGSTEAKAVDRLPSLKGKKSFVWCGLPHMRDIHEDNSRIDYVIPNLYGFARLSELDFFETPGKSGPDARFFNLLGGSGGPAAAVWFGLTCDEQVYSSDPGAGGFLYGCTLPTLYQ